MKKLVFIFSIIAVGFTSCIKNDPVTFTNSQVEFDAASWNANAVGVTYPIVTRVPVFNAAITAANSPTLLTRTSGTVRLRINLVGAPLNSDGQVTYRVVDAATTAVAGTHFTALSGTATLPKDSSFAFINLEVLNPGATTGSKDLVLELTNNATFKASTNYSKLGLRIAQN